MRRYLTQAILSIGLVVLSAAKEHLSFSEIAHNFLSNMNLKQEKPDTKVTVDMILDYELKEVGPFYIGGMNSTISLRPSINHDHTMIFARNCSQCGSTEFDHARSLEMGFLEPSQTTELI